MIAFDSHSDYESKTSQGLDQQRDGGVAVKLLVRICAVVAVGLFAEACRERLPEVEDRSALRREREERRRARTKEARRQSTLQEQVLFDFDRSDIRPDAQSILEIKAAVMQAAPTLRLRIDGYTDERGTDQYNLALGQRRAAAVRANLINLGIDPSRLTTSSFGEERPLDPRHTEEAWAKNRRVEFRAIGRRATGP